MTEDHPSRATTDSRLESAMLAGEVAWWEMDVETGAVEFHDSKAEMLGYDPADFDHYEDFTRLVHPEDHDRSMEAMRAHLEGRAEKYDVEYRIEAADGTYQWFHDVGGISERGPDGGPKRVAGIVVDITEEKAAATRAQIRNEQLALLNRIIRHDIANDMTVALGAVEMIEAERGSETQHLERIREANEHVVELTEAVGTVLTALEEEGAQEGTSVRIDEVLEEQVEAVGGMFEAATVTVDGELPAVSVVGSPLYGSAISNLLENAIEHNDTDSPTITVSATEGEQTVTVHIADDGPGIPDEQKPSVFDLGETRSEGGSGMGLFIASTVVEAFGGRIEIEDNEPRGAVFVLTLPKTDAA